MGITHPASQSNAGAPITGRTKGLSTVVVSTRQARRRERSTSDVYVGLDASLTAYGVVLWWGDGVRARLLTTKAAGDVYAYRLRHLHDQLIDTLAPYRDRVRLICMERPAYNASGAFTGGLVHAATALALLSVFDDGDTRVAPVLVAGTTLKKFATGKGSGPKAVMLKHVFTKWGYDTDNDNLADAYALARLAAAVTSGSSEHKYERDCIATVRRSMSWEPLSQQTSAPPRPVVRGRALTS